MQVSKYGLYGRNAYTIRTYLVLYSMRIVEEMTTDTVCTAIDTQHSLSLNDNVFLYERVV